jgi:hypothetical protein
MKAEAEKIRQRAAAGEDFTELQKEAFEAAGLKATEPTVSLGKITRGNLPVTHEKVFELQVGQTSQLITDAGGYYVYKVVSKQQVPFAQAKPEIQNTLQTQRMQDRMESLINSIHPQLNPDYFGGEAAAPSAARPQATPSGSKPTAPPGANPSPRPGAQPPSTDEEPLAKVSPQA